MPFHFGIFVPVVYVTTLACHDSTCETAMLNVHTEGHAHLTPGYEQRTKSHKLKQSPAADDAEAAKNERTG